MFNLNKIPTPEAPDTVQDFGVAGAVRAPIPANETPGAGIQNSISAQQHTFAPSDLASLYKMVQELPNYHTSTHHSRISTRWPQQQSVAVNPLLEHGRVADVIRLADGPFNHANGQSTTNMNEMDYYHDVSDGESDCGVSRVNESQPGSSRVRLVELERSPNCCAKHSAPTSGDHEESSRQGAVSRLQVDPATVTASVWKATKLRSLSPGKVVPLTEEKKKREMEFNAAFNFSTERCTPDARCRSCSAFFEISSPVGARYVEESDPPPVLTNLDENEAARRKGARHGPKSRSCEYRGVTFYKRTGRWEAHIWHDAAQVYLGTSATKEEAAGAYDKAALMLGGPNADINFKLESHQVEMSYIYKLSKEQFVIYVRRDMRGYGAQLMYPGVKRVHNGYQAVYGIILLGTFPTEEEAARAIYKNAVRDSCGAMANWIIDTHHVRNMPSYAAQRFAAVHPEAVEAIRSLRSQRQASAPKLISMTERQKEKCPVKEKFDSTPSKTRNSSTSSRYATSSAAAAEQQLLPTIQINDDVSPAADPQPISLTWGPHLAQKRCHRRSTCSTLLRIQHLAAQTSTSALPNESRPGHSDVSNTAAPQQTWPTMLFPVSAAPETPATLASPCRANQPTTTIRAGPLSSTDRRIIPSTPCSAEVPQGTKQLMWTEKPALGTITFKLFNVVITATEPGLRDGDNIPPEAQTPNGESGGLYTSPEENRLTDYNLGLPRKKCKIMESAPASAQLASGLIDAVSINDHLHPILAGTQPPRHETGLARVRLRPAVQTAGLAFDHPGLRAGAEASPVGFAKYRKPRCTCALCRT